MMKTALLGLATLCLGNAVGVSPIQHNSVSSNDLDYIETYQVKVDPVKEDGSLAMDISITWDVLDSSSEGPLSWVKVGVPNKYVKDLKAKTDTISELSYYYDSGSFVRVDLNKDYYEGETVHFEFSFNLSRMYKLNNEGYVYYNYATGYFDSIKVGKATLLWNADGVDSCNLTTKQDGYYVSEKSLNHGEQINIETAYPTSYFGALDKSKQYTDFAIPTKDIVIISLIVFAFVAGIIASCIAASLKADPYETNRGFIGEGYYHHWWLYHGHNHHYVGVDKHGHRYVNPSMSSSSGGSSGGGHCACACACACAGGGRAGCTKKDFHRNLKMEKVKESL